MCGPSATGRVDDHEIENMRMSCEAMTMRAQDVAGHVRCDRAATARLVQATFPKGVSTPTTSTRSGDLDAARGAAMVFVCLSHFTSAYFPSLDVPGPHQWLAAVTMVASPTFVMLSGLLLGWRHRIAPESFPRFRAHLLDRALFLLTIGHLAIEASQLRRLASPGEEPVYVVLTDVIAVALILGPAIVQRIGIRGRLLIAAAIYAVAWSLILRWTPPQDAARTLKAIMFGLRADEGSIGGYCVPILPWLAVYIVASCVGQVLASRSSAGVQLDCPMLWRVGLAAVSVAILQRLVVVDVIGSQASQSITMLSATWQKVPPGPAYLLFNGGAGLIVIACIAQLRQLAAGVAATRWLELLGRNSAIVFIGQFYVYSMLVPMVRPWTRLAWVPFFASTLLLIVLFAFGWERHRLGRFLTVQPLLRALPTLPLRTAVAVGATAVVLLLSAYADMLARQRWGIWHASAPRAGRAPGKVQVSSPSVGLRAHADTIRRQL